jgi:hypothetical protein
MKIKFYSIIFLILSNYLWGSENPSTKESCLEKIKHQTQYTVLLGAGTITLAMIYSPLGYPLTAASTYIMYTSRIATKFLEQAHKGEGRALKKAYKKYKSMAEKAQKPVLSFKHFTSLVVAGDSSMTLCPQREWYRLISRKSLIKQLMNQSQPPSESVHALY